MKDSAPDSDRTVLITRALQLSYGSVLWSVVNGIVAVVAGAGSHSLGVLGLGLNIFGDLIGSLGLVWRFRLERSHAHNAGKAEAKISLVVAGALMLIGISLATAATAELLEQSMPTSSLLSLVSSGAAVCVLVPLGMAKRRVGHRMSSRALMGDGTLSMIGATLGGAAIIGLVTNSWWHWWWADRVVALVMSVVAITEAVNVTRHRLQEP